MTSRDTYDGEKDGSGPVWTVILPVSHRYPPESPRATSRSSFWALPLATGAQECLEEREGGRQVCQLDRVQLD